MSAPTTSTMPKLSRDLSRALARPLAFLMFVALALTHGYAHAQTRPAYTQAELDQMLAPIALYPDPLLSQILMAATYPIEVVEAARWSRANPGLQGDDATRAVEDKDWDPSVKSLVAFPNVLARMDEDLEWTRRLGDAFLEQEPHVMQTVQQLRARARAAGTLGPGDRIRVVDDGPNIVLVPADPSVIYVPYYDPRVAYGSWWWPAYPPVYWAPWPGYVVHAPYPRPGVATGFYWGPAIPVSLGFFFGGVDWQRHEVRVVHVDNYYYRPAVVRRDVYVHPPVVVAPGVWQHDPWHRRGVAYRDPDVQRRFAPATPHVAPSSPRTPRAAPPSPPTRGSAPQPSGPPHVAPPSPGTPRVAPPSHEVPRAAQPSPAASRAAPPPSDAPRAARPPSEAPRTAAPPSPAAPPLHEAPRAAPQLPAASRTVPPPSEAPRVAAPAQVRQVPRPDASAAPGVRTEHRQDMGRPENRPDTRRPAVYEQPRRETSGAPDRHASPRQQENRGEQQRRGERP